MHCQKSLSPSSAWEKFMSARAAKGITEIYVNTKVFAEALGK